MNMKFEMVPKTEIARLFLEIGKASERQGLQPYTVDEMLNAIESERAGNGGLEKLWRKSEAISTQM